MIFNITKRISKFDEVTQFRLRNMFLFCIGYFLIIPILAQLKGIYLASWIISMFMIGEQLMNKTNRFLVENYSISTLFRIGNIVHLLTILVALMFFVNPLYMVVGDSLLSLLDIAIFNAYSIKLTNYLTEFYPQDMSEFQIIRNSIWTDAVLLSLGITSFITYFWDNGVAIGFFIVYNIFFSLYLFKNWRFYTNKNI